MRDLTGSWLSGPTMRADGSAPRYRGERLGLAESGEGSLATLGVRAGALLVDWLLAYAVVGLAVMVFGPGAFGADSPAGVSSWAVPLVWGLLGVVCVTLFAQTPGQALLGLGTARVDAPQRVGLWRSVLRVVLVFFLLPPLIQDEDGRGMHDRATGTAVIRTR